MRIIRLSTDYGCYPLWEASPELVGNIDPHSLPISTQLCSRLLAWAKVYNDTLDYGNPVQSGFKTDDDRKSFDEEGNKLYRLLVIELGQDFQVIMRNKHVAQVLPSS